MSAASLSRYGLRRCLVFLFVSERIGENGKEGRGRGRGGGGGRGASVLLSLFLGRLKPQQHEMCLSNTTCVHNQIDVQDQTRYFTQSQSTGPTSSRVDPIAPDVRRVILDLEKLGAIRGSSAL